jgi:aldehyde dehydrogenase (NAD+)
LETAGLELAARAEELGEQLAREEGKPRGEAIGEVQRASQIFRFFAGEALRVAGEHIRSVRPGVDVAYSRAARRGRDHHTVELPDRDPGGRSRRRSRTAAQDRARRARAGERVVDGGRDGAPPGVCNLVVGPGSVVGNGSCTILGSVA